MACSGLLPFVWDRANGGINYAGIGTTVSVVALPDTSSYQDVQYWLAKRVRFFVTYYTLVVVRGLSPRSADAAPYVSSTPLSSLFPSVESSQLVCSVIEYAANLSQVYIGCKDTILVLRVGSDGLPIQNSQRSVRVGSGSYTALRFDPPSGNLYTATDNGLCFVHDTTRTNLNIFKVTVVPQLEGDYAVSIYVDSKVPTVTTAFWGTARGQFFRSDWPGLTLAIQSRLTLSSNSELQLSIGSIISHPTDDMTLLFTANEVPANPGSLPHMDGTNSVIIGTSKDNCQFWNNDCNSCGKSPYCGWCYSWNKCLPKSQCTGGSTSTWTQKPTCPKTTNAVPMRGDKYGGTNVTVSGSFLTTQQFSLYYCQWIITSASYIEKRDSQDAMVTFPTPVPAVAPLFFSENMMICPYPGIASKQLSLGPGEFATATLNVLLNGILWGSAFPDFKIFDCGAYTTCDSCNSQIMFPECGWCYKTGNCTIQTTCDVAGLNATKAWSTEASTCPSTLAWTQPASISARASGSSSTALARTLRMDLSNIQPAPNGMSYQCSFTSLNDAAFNRSTPDAYPASQAAVTASADGLSLFSLTCVMPTSLSTSQDGIYRIHLRLGNYFPTGASSSVYLYDCPSITRCDMCSNSTFGDCGWTTAGTCQYKSDITSGQGTSSCASLISSNPAVTEVSSSKGLSLSLTGVNLNVQSSDLKCLFQSSSSPTIFFSTTTSSLTAISVTCATPTDSGFNTGLWQLSLTPSSATTSLPLMKPLSFEIYDCAAQASCGDCLSRIACSWCADSLQALHCSVSTSSNCTAPITSNATCPTISSASPVPLLTNSDKVVTIVMRDALPSGAEDSLSCAVSLTSMETGGPLVQTSSFSLGGDSKTVTCNGLDLSGTPGNVTIGIYNSASARFYSNPYPIPIVSCPLFTDCTSCLNSGCLWCAGGCGSTCPTASLSVGSSCPTITAISPSFADSQASVRVTISGTNFMQPYSNPALPDDSSTSSSSSSSKRFAQYELLDGGLTNWSSASEFSRRTFLATIGTLEDYYYRCRWGNLITPAFWSSSTTIFCNTPVIGTFSPTSSYPFSLMIGPSNFASASSASALSFYQCPEIASDVCTSECMAATHCGWCVSQGSCTSNTACLTSNNTDTSSINYIQPIWQASCVVAQLSSSFSFVPGGTLLNVTFSAPFPASLTVSDLKCRFGSTDVVVAGVVREEDSQDILAVSCSIPPSPTGTSYSGLFEVIYKERSMTASQRFSYVDCGRYKTCGSCQSENLCGWCRSGKDRCTVASECPADQWSRTHCPLNVLAVALGTILGFLFVACVSALILFLALRAYKRRKAGLVIRLQEPDYDAIAWGRDRELQYKISVTRYSILHASLGREDFLLQLALSLNCPATEQESLAKGLVYVACAHDSASAMIRALIRAEVSQCPAENQLFRSNSVASKMYKFYSRIVGIKYLFHCLGRVIQELEVLGKKSAMRRQDTAQEVSILNVTMELDLDKYDGTGSSFGDIAETVDAHTNLLQLQLICQKILNVLIKQSTNNIPRPLREIFVEIDTSVTEKYPGSTEAIYKGLGGLFFLRFVCPAITAPHVYGLLEQPPIETTQRQLVLIGKVIQSIANMSPPTQNKEGYMEPMANFIRSSIPRIKQFYDNLRRAANISGHSTIYERNLMVPEEVLLNGLAATHSVLIAEAPKLKAWCALPSDQTGIGETQAQELVQIVDACLQEEPSTSRTNRASSGAKKSRKSSKVPSTSSKTRPQ